MTVLAEDANARRHNKEARVREQGVQTNGTVGSGLQQRAAALGAPNPSRAVTFHGLWVTAGSPPLGR